MESAPETSDSVPGLAAELALGSNINRRVGPELETEDIRVLGGIGSTRKFEQDCDPICLGARRLRNRGQGAEEFRQLLRPLFSGAGLGSR